MLPARFRADFGRRATGIILAVLIEGLVLLALLSLSQLQTEDDKPGLALSTFEVSAEPEPQPEEPSPEPSVKEAPQPPKPKPAEPKQEEQKEPAPTRPIMIPLTHDQMVSADIAKAPTQPKESSTSEPVIGPPDIGGPQDTPRIGGVGPHGEPLYAASWYREPYPDELRGYLSTAMGPGWGRIACRTVPDFRVDDCVIVDEYPKGSNIARAVLAASWQFRVRPPRIGGRSMVGEWVGIRIDYNFRPK
ncbi:hypothetical protein MB02_00855 [Croceicoccus estronivorus]|nr:hypothetical protein MB02_00855 [Croceicoccus estronivorus]